MVELRPHQIEDLAVAIKHKRSLNLSEPGCGKTPVFCAYAWWAWTRNSEKSIIVQPNSLRDKNRRECIRFTGFKPEEVVVLEKASETLGPRKRIGTTADPETGFINYIDNDDAKVFIVGFTFLKTYWRELLQFHPEINLVIVDEGHLGYKTYNSKASKELYNLMDECERFLYCTGSPIDGRLDTAFVPIHIVQPSYYGSYAGFKAQHAGFEDDYGRVLWWVNEEKVTEIFNRHGVLRKWQDVHGEQTRHIEIIDDLQMTGKMEEAYREFEHMACVELDGMFFDGSNPGVATMRARQIINCPSKFGINEKTPKQEYVEGIAEPATLLFGSMPEEVEQYAELLRQNDLKVGVIHGGVSRTQRDEIDQAYQAGELDVICATAVTAGFGYNWQRTKTIIYTSLDYQDSNVEQSIKRGERELRDTPLNIYFLEYEDSVDQRVRKIVVKKENLTQTVMGNVKGLSK